MDILLIGGTGNLSTECAAVLHAQGHRVSVLTRGRNPVPAGYEAIRADHGDPAALAAALAGRRFAAAVSFIGYDVPDVRLDADLLRGRVEQYVFISTTVVYRKPPTHLPVTEDEPQGNAFSAYGRKKQACEEFLWERLRTDGFPVTIVRPSHTYSCRWLPNPVTSVGYTVAARLEQGRPVFIHDDGQGLWTLTAAEDFAAGLAGLIGHPAAIGESFHITSDEVLTWNRILAEIALALGVGQPQVVHIPTDFIAEVESVMQDKLKGDKAHPGIFDTAKLRRLVPDFECRIPFRTGVRRAIAWFREDAARRQVDPGIDSLFDRVITAWGERAA
jgi:nucleoside-diphosphate-sugar epimerase